MEMNQKDKMTSLVVSDEFKQDEFKSHKIDNLKQLLAGDGGVVEQKGKHPFTAYVNSNFFLCCNDLPEILAKTRDELGTSMWHQRTALKVRMKLFHFTFSHEYNDPNPFPLNANKIACLLKYFVGVAKEEKRPHSQVLTQ